MISGVGFDVPSKLLACCVLHDIGRLRFDQSVVFSIPDHGEVGATFIQSLGYAEHELVYAISNHMYGWRVVNLFNQVLTGGVTASLVLLAMLCECDYFATRFAK